jgi:hypothetical protein
MARWANREFVNAPFKPAPIVVATQEEPGMFDFFRNFRSFLKAYRYHDLNQLLANIDERVIGPPEAAVRRREAE